jgi:hypothetical protein
MMTWHDFVMQLLLILAPATILDRGGDRDLRRVDLPGGFAASGGRQSYRKRCRYSDSFPDVAFG